MNHSLVLSAVAATAITTAFLSSSAKAAILTYQFSINLTSGPYAGQTGAGVFSFDDLGRPFRPDSDFPFTDSQRYPLTSLDVDLLGHRFTQADASKGANAVIVRNFTPYVPASFSPHPEKGIGFSFSFGYGDPNLLGYSIAATGETGRGETTPAQLVAEVPEPASLLGTLTAVVWVSTIQRRKMKR